jgi:hypothetical protein
MTDTRLSKFGGALGGPTGWVVVGYKEWLFAGKHAAKALAYSERGTFDW